MHQITRYSHQFSYIVMSISVIFVGYIIWQVTLAKLDDNHYSHFVSSFFQRMDALKHRMKNKENNGKESKFLTFLLTQKSLTFKEITSATVELLTAAVETVSRKGNNLTQEMLRSFSKIMLNRNFFKS